MFAAGLIESHESFSSGGKPVQAEMFVPKKNGRFPLVLLLHAEDGLRNPLYQRYAKKLAGKGYAVMLVHYFDRTGTAEKPSLNDIKKNFLSWMATINDAVTYGMKNPQVRAGPAGLVGLSLGATLALAQATQDARIGAVVEFFGLLPDQIRPFIQRLCPTLILHGGRDLTVPVDEAHKMRRLLEDRRVPYQIRIYAKEGHSLGTWNFRNAASLTMAFLNKNLKSVSNTAAENRSHEVPIL